MYEQLTLAMNAGAGTIPHCMKGQPRRNLLRRLADEGVITLCDRAGKTLPSSKSWGGPIDDAAIFVPTCQVEVIRREIVNEAKAIRADEKRQAEERHIQWLASLPRLTKAEAAVRNLDTATGWHRAGFTRPQKSEAVALLGGRFFLFPKPAFFRVGGPYETLGLRSKTAWQREGRKLKPGVKPRATVAGRWCDFPVYSEDQTNPTVLMFPQPVVEEEAEIAELRAIVTPAEIAAWKAEDEAKDARQTELPDEEDFNNPELNPQRELFKMKMTRGLYSLIVACPVCKQEVFVTARNRLYCHNIAKGERCPSSGAAVIGTRVQYPDPPPLPR